MSALLSMPEPEPRLLIIDEPADAVELVVVGVVVVTLASETIPL
jgi:ABC-type molybdenum transport system ATPase subunit/photorepair protein PhrA